MDTERKGKSTDRRQTGANRARQTLRAANQAAHQASVPEREWRAERTARIDHKIADQIARDQAEVEARRKYHTAWQEYYQKYYGHYYLQQLQLQRQQVARGDGETTSLSPRQQAIDKLRRDLIKKIGAGADRAVKSRHFKPILAGVIIVLLLGFIQYNQLFSAAVRGLVSPGSQNISSLIIADGSYQPVNANPTVLIPKINVKAPIIFGLDDLSESSSQRALEHGVIHFPVAGANSVPGQNGNTVILGHSSSDIFNGGQFKFIFVQLNRMSVGDLFYVDYGGKRYSYEVTEKRMVAPGQLEALNMGVAAPFATLVTCDPPGTTWSRLLVIAQQISPSPAGAKVNDDVAGQSTGSIPGAPPTLFERLFR